jgi:hypothetical protein
MTYTEGWPKQAPVEWGELVPTWVVPLSDAERLREERDKEHAAGMEIAREHAEAVADAERLQEALGEAANIIADLSRILDPGSQAEAMCDRALLLLDREGEPTDSEERPGWIGDTNAEPTYPLDREGEG